MCIDFYGMNFSNFPILFIFISFILCDEKYQNTHEHRSIME